MIAGPVFESNVGPVRVIDIFGTKRAERGNRARCVRGELIVSVCMTEPEAGSDSQLLPLMLWRIGDHYILNGRKCFINRRGHASHYMV